MLIQFGNLRKIDWCKRSIQRKLDNTISNLACYIIITCGHKRSIYLSNGIKANCVLPNPEHGSVIFNVGDTLGFLKNGGSYSHERRKKEEREAERRLRRKRRKGRK